MSKRIAVPRLRPETPTEPSRLVVHFSGFPRRLDFFLIIHIRQIEDSRIRLVKRIQRLKLPSVEPIELAFGLLGLIAVGIAAMLFGEAFRAHVFLFLTVWLSLPVLSVCIRKWGLFEAKSLRRLRIGFMVFVLAVSAYVFVGLTDVRNSIGEHFIEGYRHWTTETGENDDGETTYGQDWTADSASGRRALSGLQVIAVAFAIACPVITWKTLQAAIEHRKAEEDQYLAEVDPTNDKL